MYNKLGNLIFVLVILIINLHTLNGGPNVQQWKNFKSVREWKPKQRVTNYTHRPKIRFSKNEYSRDNKFIDDRLRMMQISIWKFKIVPKLLLFIKMDLERSINNETVDGAFVLVLSFMDEIVGQQGVAKPEKINSIRLEMHTHTTRDKIGVPHLTGEKNPYTQERYSGDRGFYVRFELDGGNVYDFGLVMFYNDEHKFAHKFSKRFKEFTSTLFYNLADFEDPNGPTLVLHTPKNLQQNNMFFYMWPSKGNYLVFPHNISPHLGQPFNENSLQGGVYYYTHLNDVLIYNSKVYKQVGDDFVDTGYYRQLPQAIQIG